MLEAVHPPQVANTRARIRVVIADDDPAIRRCLAWILRDVCEVVRCVPTGEELLEAALACQPEVIVSDAMLPAFVSAEAVPRLHAGGTCSFVLLSDSRHDIQQWIEEGACCVVHAMDVDTDLPAAVEAAAAGEIYISRRAIQAGRYDWGAS